MFKDRSVYILVINYLVVWHLNPFSSLHYKIDIRSLVGEEKRSEAFIEVMNAH